MTQTRSYPALELARQLAHGYYLRTGHLLKTDVFLEEIQRKFNHNHDPNNGQFTFGTSGGHSGTNSGATGARIYARKPTYPVRVALPVGPTYPVRVVLPVSKLMRPNIHQANSDDNRPQLSTIRFSHSLGIDLPGPVIDKANILSDAVSQATGHGIHVTSGRRNAVRQAAAMYDNYFNNRVPNYLNKAAEAEVRTAYHQALRSGVSRDHAITEMANVLSRQVGNGIFLSLHMRSGAIDIRTPPANVLRAIRNHPSVQSATVEKNHIHIQFR
ncbi:MAG: hypothetical protein ABIM50_09440 [Novosphingobium sp.]